MSARVKASLFTKGSEDSIGIVVQVEDGIKFSDMSIVHDEYSVVMSCMAIMQSSS
jgi:hypothetical protein